MSSLRRVRVDKFNIENAVTLEDLEEYKNDEDFKNKYFLRTEDVFFNFENIILNKRKEELFLNGVKLTFELPNGTYNI